jgi:polar amino acid transport system substrate-binding protein
MNVMVSAKRALLGAASLAFAMAGLSGAARAGNITLPASIAASKTITFCSAMTQPPFEFFNAEQKPEGVDIDMGALLAKNLGVRVKWINVPFAGVIPALLAGHCDAVLSGTNITPTRLKMVDMVPYRYAGEDVLLKAGAPKLSGLDALAGKKVATVTGTAAVMLMQRASDQLVKAGKPPISIVMYPDNASALQHLQFGQVDAFGVAYETAVYYDRIDPGQFELGLAPFRKIPDGIAVRKDDTVLKTAIETALAGLMKDGSYAAAYNKWGIGFDILS